jgi:nitrate reductase NapAB chaperone NapD
MIITGSALLIRPGSLATVLEKLKQFPGVTFHGNSESGTELVITLEAEDHQALDQLCSDLTDAIPEALNITHIYVNFEEEIEKIQAGRSDKDVFPKPDLPD